MTADGRSDRGNFPVFQRNMRQWMMRITTYADRLIDDLELLDWSDAIKTMQRNWIGRSHGANVHFESAAGDITVFTTRPDTLFGATFMVLAPEHPYVDALTTPEQSEAVADYIRRSAAKNEIDRTDDTREKTGVFTGSYATNPLNDEPIQIWIADYVLMGYGTGAIMAVPCGDHRDFEFARQFALPIRPIQRPPASWFESHRVRATPTTALDTSLWPEAYIGDAPYVNSSNDSLDLNGIDNKADGIAAVNAWLEATGAGEATTTYKLPRLALQPAAVLGRAVPDRVRRRRQPALAARRDAAGRVARDRQLLAPHVRRRRRILEPREPARPAPAVGRGDARPR